LVFVHFCWRHTYRLSLNKYALTLFCPASNSEPTLLCLKYYRATADEWKDTSNCDSYFEQNQQLVRPYSYCKLPDECSCPICNRQPPSLHDIASHTLFNGRIQSFRLTAHTTYQEYVRAALSHCVDNEKLMQPEYPTVRVWCRFDMFHNKVHRDCPGRGTWHAEMCKDYASPADDIKELVELKETMWCSHCERGLFVPNTCSDHLDSGD
jgi:hypothetical protein